MITVAYNSKLAKVLLYFSKHSTISLFGHVFVKDAKDEDIARFKRLLLYALQYREVSNLFLWITLAVLCFTGGPFWAILSYVFAYYIWWATEWGIRKIIAIIRRKKAAPICFVQEAIWSGDYPLLETTREVCFWMHFFKKQ